MDYKKIDKTASKISSIYAKGVEEVVGKMMKAKDKLTPEEFAAQVKDIDLTETLQVKLKDIKKEYLKSHIQILKDKKPIQ